MAKASLILPKNTQGYGSLKVVVAANFLKDALNIEHQTNDRNVPSLVSNNLTLLDCNAISHAIGQNLLWGNDSKENALIYQWIEFADIRLHPAVCLWTFPYLGIRKYSEKEEKQATSELKKCLAILNNHLLANMYLVGDRITQADITSTAALLPAYQLVLDEKLQSEFENVTRWFKTLINQPQFKQELTKFVDGDQEIILCKNPPVFNEKLYQELQSKLDSNQENTKPKTAAQLKKEAKKKEKMEKFLAKKQKMEQNKTAESKKEPKKSEKKEKKAVASTYDKEIAPGEKKDISGPLPESYSPKYVEAVWYPWWEKMGFFRPEYGGRDVHKTNPRGRFMICLPPPNVTGSLHLGHALTNTIPDVLSRWRRMRGETVLWVPGTDHAGIATQVVVEKKLWREKKLSRHDLGRENFVNEVWKWKAEKGNLICHQLRKLGSSLDWGREFFTMNENLSYAVKHSFVLLHDRGTIFRSNRLVNWSCTLRSAISDIEVNKLELTGRTLLSVPGYSEKVEFGVLISFAYPIVDSDGEELIVATTRIETMLGDTAVAVHPEDSRYKHLHGKFVRHPFSERLLPIVCDEMVDMGFGTGAVKITPAHDANDYDCGKRHNLKFITIFTDDGHVTNTDSRFDGMKRFDARIAVLDALKEKQLYRETKDNPMVVPICSRSKDIVEPLIKVQWFMDCKDAAKKAVEAVKDGRLKITPDMHCKTWFHWLENIRDWCISRQLWWGHRIPAYFVTIDDPNVAKGEVNSPNFRSGQATSIIVAVANPQEIDGHYWVSGLTEEEAKRKAAERFNVDPSKITLRQDEDVLDTWYSSGLLPFSIFGWPNQTPDLQTFFPGTLLETGHDILFFWVARMVMFAIMLTGKLPFEEVYLHALVRDAHGRKMSKSLGNVIDPLDVINGITLEELHTTLLSGNLDAREIERAKAGQKQDYPNGIPECGSDALRFALCAYTCQGRDINLDVLRILGYRHFCNKMWNAFRFAMRGLGDEFKPSQNAEPTGSESLLDKWILSKLSRAAQSSEEGLQKYDFPVYTTAVFNFWLYDLCDVYLEYLKSVFASSNPDSIQTSRNVLYTCLDVALRLVHPLMPFISEELWQRLPRRPGDDTPSVSVSAWPELDQHSWFDDVIESDVDLMMNVVKAARSLRAQYQLTRTKAEIYVRCSDGIDKTIANYVDFIQTLSTSSKVATLGHDAPSPPGCAVAIVNAKCDVCMLLKGLVDPEKEISKLRSKREEQTKKLKSLQNRMLQAEYKNKVPQNVQDLDLAKVQGIEAELTKMSKAENDFQQLLESS